MFVYYLPVKLLLFPCQLTPLHTVRFFTVIALSKGRLEGIGHQKVPPHRRNLALRPVLNTRWDEPREFICPNPRLNASNAVQTARTEAPRAIGHPLQQRGRVSGSVRRVWMR